MTPEEIEVVYEDYDPEDEAPTGILTAPEFEGDCAGDGG